LLNGASMFSVIVLGIHLTDEISKRYGENANPFRLYLIFKQLSVFLLRSKGTLDRVPFAETVQSE